MSINSVLRKAIEELETFSNNMQRRKTEGETNKSDREGGHLVYTHQGGRGDQGIGQKNPT